MGFHFTVWARPPFGLVRQAFSLRGIPFRSLGPSAVRSQRGAPFIVRFRSGGFRSWGCVRAGILGSGPLSSFMSPGGLVAPGDPMLRISVRGPQSCQGYFVAPVLSLILPWGPSPIRHADFGPDFEDVRSLIP